MSLKALINLMKKKGFIFLGVNYLKNNAFFINEDFKNNFDKIIENINSNCLNEFTNNEFMESRDKNGNLSLLNKKQQINEIKDCYVINLENSKEDLVKLKDFI